MAKTGFYLLNAFCISWMDTTRLEAGSDWRLDIGNGLLNSKLVLFVASRASMVSDWCIKELHMARKHNLVVSFLYSHNYHLMIPKIIPIWYQRVEYDSEVKSLIFGRAFVDFSNEAYFKSKGNILAKKLKYALSIRMLL